MLFDPTILVREPGLLIATLLIVVLGKSAAALLIVLAFRHPLRTALAIAASLAQIGEFSFILAGLGVTLGLLPEQGWDLILAVAIFSILLNPLFFAALDHLHSWLEHRRAECTIQLAVAEPTATDLPTTHLKDHLVLVGFGRVGSRVGEELQREELPFLVIEDQHEVVDKLRADGIEALHGNAAAPKVIGAANLAKARCLLVAIPDGFEAGQIVEQGRTANPKIEIIARAHSDEEVQYLKRSGARRSGVGGDCRVDRRPAAASLAFERGTAAVAFATCWRCNCGSNHTGGTAARRPDSIFPLTNRPIFPKLLRTI